MEKTPDTKPLYIRKHQGALPPNGRTAAALARVPESFTLRGNWFSFAPEMQTKGLVMQKETFLKLFKHKISEAEVYEQVKIVDVEQPQYTNEFSNLSPDHVKPIPMKLRDGDVRSKHWESNKFWPSDHFLFVQGECTNTHPWITNGLGRMFVYLRALMIGHRLQNLTMCPTLQADSYWYDGKSVVVTFLKNTEKNYFPLPALGIALNESHGVTSRWLGYYQSAVGKLSPGNSVPPLWQSVRPLFAIANHLAVDYALSGNGPAYADVDFLRY